ncbi:MAG TPA: hypothetical protein VFG68_01075, partial [Fimbriiglobus sp.]|nr:hypothetical protein [Fimbriiglobus sp.]
LHRRPAGGEIACTSYTNTALYAPAPAPAFSGGMPTYTAPPVFSGPPSTLIPGPQVMPEKPMPTTGGMK